MTKFRFKIGFLIAVLGWSGCAQRMKQAPAGWPERLGQRGMYEGTHGYIYAGSAWEAGRIKDLLGKAAKDVRKDIEANLPAGLVLVVDSGEEALLDVEKLLDMAEMATEAEDNEAQKGLRDISKAKKTIEEHGLDMNVILSLTPVPVEPKSLPELIEGFGKETTTEIGWCVIVPTEGKIREGFKALIKAALEKEEVGVLERTMLTALMPMIEQKAVTKIKKARQVVLYQVLLETQAGLSKAEKEEKFEAYQSKLGLGD